ncbi:hypothetical protein CC1G_15280 [Coprinopsis cinerea okayama7|uniref:Helitron helicase-like domain-containing protein n=1 Tax=Coprinopsis cinerea (strain Okayama-7 / 130 / ATCC MYA-4618 / FGSC 9003) TaxID=240176 RepID=D6RQ57_COPC7|nr:hypothetical protein CC1G_15280 [Coprinopsis cinerea okayama7\|eukprot:XP_002910373.1 hypothetical protein CC1G_15280 [Coprinopsis cinerea okayama7\
MPTDGSLLPFHVEHLQPNSARDATTSGYDPFESLKETPVETTELGDVPFQSVLIANASPDMTSHELRASAVKHVIDKNEGFYGIPHDVGLVNDIKNSALFPMLFPSLFPFGFGAPEAKKNAFPVSFESHIRHLLCIRERRFQEHHSFMFTAFNIIQRRKVLLSIALRTRRSSFDDVASTFAGVSSLAVSEVLDKIVTSLSTNSYPVPDTHAQSQALNLNKQVNVIFRDVPGSSGSRVTMRNEIRSMFATELGLPSLYVTVNPPDVFNPLVAVLGGSDIDIDNLPDNLVPTYWDLAKLVSQNPVVAAKFFHIYINAFITELLAWDEDARTDPTKRRIGALGYTKGLYGCVEAQGRGTLHAHFVIWIEGSLNPNELKAKLLHEANALFRDKLAEYLDDIIVNSIPKIPPGATTTTVQSDRFKPSSVRGYDPLLDDEQSCLKRSKDFRNLVIDCQVHEHTPTCYKYWRGPPAPKECRFNLGAEALIMLVYSFVVSLLPASPSVTMGAKPGLLVHCRRCRIGKQKRVDRRDNGGRQKGGRAAQ